MLFRSKRRKAELAADAVDRADEIDDMHEARAVRAEAREQLGALETQRPGVERLVDRLVARRKLNHFGDDIQVTFTPRGNHG